MLLPAETDEALWTYFATAGVPDEERVGKIVDALAARPRTLVELENTTALRRGRLEGLLKILSVDGVVQREGTAWSLTGKPWVHDHEKWQALARVRAHEAGLMRAYAAGAGCLMRFLQTALDDPEPADCGRCSVCTGQLPHPGLQPSPQNVEAARVFVRGRDVVIEPRKLWPSGLGAANVQSGGIDGGKRGGSGDGEEEARAPRKGRIVGCEDGRALAFAEDPGWAELLRPVFTGADAPAPPEVLAGIVAVLGRWRRSWGARPVAVVPVPSREHPLLVQSVVQHIAAVGRLPVIDALALSGPPPPQDTASAARVTALLQGLKLRPDVPVPAGPLLLVDARYRSGWTATVAAALLREAGATAVLPLVVQQLP